MRIQFAARVTAMCMVLLLVLPIASAFAGSTLDELARGKFKALPGGPLIGTYPRVIASTGSDVLVWAEQSDTATAMLAIYDPRVAKWRTPVVPVSARRGRAVWAGDALIVWTATEAWAYELEAGEWRTLAAPPVDVTRGPQTVAVWTGREVVILLRHYEGESSPPPVGGLTYEPTTNTWRTISLPPVQLWACSLPDGVASTGSSVLTWGLDAYFGGEWRLLAYTPASDTWQIQTSPPPTSEGCLAGGAIARGELVVIDALGHASVYDLRDDLWRVTSPVLAREVITIAIPITINGVVAVEAKGRLRFYDRIRQEWLVGPKTGRFDGTAMLVAVGDSVYRASRYGLARYRPGTSSSAFVVEPRGHGTSGASASPIIGLARGWE